VFSLSYLSILIFGGNALANTFRRRKALASLGTGAVGVVMLGFAARLAGG